ncbi:hypothetical protein [Stenotrophomonas maltophilia]|uniref:hypothetical protein n=1 Tax=Stenotrophomonas maltophilia TaxID=40324 RepID=UPI00117E1A71|nr:hypothetical protein [Stenotrophomonas maltophilia]
MRIVSRDNRIAEMFVADLNSSHSFPNSFLIPSDEYHPSLCRRPDYGMQLGIIEQIRSIATAIYEKLNEDDTLGFTHQKLLMSFSRSDSMLSIKSALGGDFQTDYDVESIIEALMYNEMCSYRGERIREARYFIPLTNEQRDRLFDEQSRLLVESEKITRQMQLIQRILNQ